ERALVHLQHVLRLLPNPLRDGPPVLRTEIERLENQQIQRPLKQIDGRLVARGLRRSRHARELQRLIVDDRQEENKWTDSETWIQGFGDRYARSRGVRHKSVAPELSSELNVDRILTRSPASSTFRRYGAYRSSTAFSGTTIRRSFAMNVSGYAIQ